MASKKKANMASATPAGAVKPPKASKSATPAPQKSTSSPAGLGKTGGSKTGRAAKKP